LVNFSSRRNVISSNKAVSLTWSVSIVTCSQSSIHRSFCSVCMLSVLQWDYQTLRINSYFPGERGKEPLRGRAKRPSDAAATAESVLEVNFPVPIHSSGCRRRVLGSVIKVGNEIFNADISRVSRPVCARRHPCLLPGGCCPSVADNRRFAQPSPVHSGKTG
jgi:hypothetical protein